MTVSAYVPATFQGNGATTLFPYTFDIPAGSAVITLYNSTTFEETVLVEGTDYSVSAYDNPAGGNVSYPLIGAAMPAGFYLTIARDVPETQNLDLTNQSSYFPEQLENQLDNIVMMIQATRAIADSSFRVPTGSGVDPTDLFSEIEGSVGAAATSATAAATSATSSAGSATAAAASALAAAASVGAVTPGIGQFLLDTGTADAMVITPNPAIAAYSDGQLFFIRKSANANATTTPTLVVSGKAAKTIQKRSAGALVALLAGDMQASGEILVSYNLAADKMVLELSSSAGLPLTGGTMTGQLIAAAGTIGAPGLAVGGGGQGLYWDGTSLSINAGGTIRLQITATKSSFFNGDVTVQTVLDLSAASAGQIKFPAAQNSSANANTNDDYEEGTYTSGLSLGGGTTGITYSEQPGVYTKYGRGVTVAGDFVLTSKGSSTGSAAITGLPFGIQGNQTTFLPKVSGMSSLTGAVKGAAPGGGGTTINLTQSGSAGDSTISNTSFSGTDTIIYGGAYMTST